MIKNINSVNKIKRERCNEYIEALEEERRKIHVFQRELPLCLDLVTHAIEGYRRELSVTTTENVKGESECSEQTTGECGTVLDLFKPIKHSSISIEEEVEDEDFDFEEEQEHEFDDDKSMKSDWLKSVQLWNQSEPVLNESKRLQEETETVVEVIKRNEIESASQPRFYNHQLSFYETSNVNNDCDRKTPTAATISGGCGRRKETEKDGGQRKQRRCWSRELHKRFLNALQQLGGPHVATPKQIRELMKIDGLTNDEVKSHLQKYRLHTRRPNQTAPNKKNSQTPHFVVVGGIWIPQSEYSTDNSTVPAGGNKGTCTPAGIYGPMANPLPLPLQWPSHSNFGSENRSRCHSEAMSSSTRIITNTRDVKRKTSYWET